MTSLTRVAPELPVRNMAEALLYYERQLGFETVMRMPAGDYAVVERDGVAIHLFESAAAGVQPASIHIFATGLDELWHELEVRGAQLAEGIVSRPWGNRDFRAMDPSGNIIKFTESLEASG